MSSSSHPFSQGFPNSQSGGMRSQFGANSMQNQMGNPMANQMPVQMGGQMGNQMVSPMSTPLGNQMPTTMSTSMGNQMLNQMNQQYMSSNMQNGQMPQHPNQSSLQMPQTSLHHTLQQQPTPHTTPQPTATPTPPAQPPPSQNKEFNTASLCRIGQETVQDIVSRTQEVFQTLKAIQPPNGTPPGLTASNEKKVKVQEQLRTIRVLFKRLRLIYEKCNENCQLQGMEYTHIETLIPFKEDIEPKHDEKKNSEAYRQACEESKEVMEQVVLKNRQLKEVIDHLRRIIWEINTMLTMRRS